MMQQLLQSSDSGVLSPSRLEPGDNNRAHLKDHMQWKWLMDVDSWRSVIIGFGFVFLLFSLLYSVLLLFICGMLRWSNYKLRGFRVVYDVAT